MPYIRPRNSAKDVMRGERDWEKRSRVRRVVHSQSFPRQQASKRQSGSKVEVALSTKALIEMPALPCIRDIKPYGVITPNNGVKHM
jgi:hypothetical protein